MSNRLPDKPSELIRLALKDLSIIARRTRKYKINMGVYFQPSGCDNKCHVCFAGSVMANTLGCDPKNNAYTGDFDLDTRSKLRALDCFRTGDLRGGLSWLNFYRPEIGNRHITACGTDKNLFKEGMKQMANDLEKVGL